MLNKIKSFSLPLICALLSAITVVLIKRINGEMDSIALGLVRLIITALSLVPFVLIKKEYKKLNTTDCLWFLLIGFVGYFLNTTFYFSALLHAPALNVALINVLIPLLTLFFSFLFFGEVPSKQEIAAFVVAFVGVAFVITEGQFDMGALIDSYGEFLALSSSVCWVLYTMIVWYFRGKYSPYFIVFAGSLLGAVFTVPVVWWHGGMLRTLSVLDDYWLAVGYICLFGSTVLYLLYIRSIELIGPSLTAFSMYSTRPIMVAILAYFVLGSLVSWWQLIGGCLIIVALYLATQVQQPKTT